MFDDTLCKCLPQTLQSLIKKLNVNKVLAAYRQTFFSAQLSPETYSGILVCR